MGDDYSLDLEAEWAWGHVASLDTGLQRVVVAWQVLWDDLEEDVRVHQDQEIEFVEAVEVVHSLESLSALC